MTIYNLHICHDLSLKSSDMSIRLSKYKSSQMKKCGNFKPLNLISIETYCYSCPKRKNAGNSVFLRHLQTQAKAAVHTCHELPRLFDRYVDSFPIAATAGLIFHCFSDSSTLNLFIY